jgi:hypothetical protein
MNGLIKDLRIRVSNFFTTWLGIVLQKYPKFG